MDLTYLEIFLIYFVGARFFLFNHGKLKYVRQTFYRILNPQFIEDCTRKPLDNFNPCMFMHNLLSFFVTEGQYSTFKFNVVDMILILTSCSEARVLKSMELPFIVITPRFTLREVSYL